MPKTNRWHPRFVRRYFVQRWLVPHTMNDGRISPNQRAQDLSEVVAQVEAETRYKPVPDDPPPPDDDPPP
ncbi:MAG: hypothetical protein NTX53_19985 [candidate division WOR-3 bacterium]|nr:hypothetical protein [candidate division WOR-3 bacterium]